MAVITLNKTNFKETIEKNPFVVVDFWAPWCEPCVAFSPTFESAAAKNSDIVFGMVNTETDPEIGDYFGGRDHTTVIHACRKIKELVLEESDFSEDYKNLMRTLSS